MGSPLELDMLFKALLHYLCIMVANSAILSIYDVTHGVIHCADNAHILISSDNSRRFSRFHSLTQVPYNFEHLFSFFLFLISKTKFFFAFCNIFLVVIFFSL